MSASKSELKSAPKSIKIEMIDQDIALITIDIQGESQNTLRAEFANEFNEILDSFQKLSPVGVILTSGKKDSFIVGADINMLSQLKTTEQVLELSKAGYETFDRLEQLDIPVVAEIHGACLGGGLELTLACHGRVCSNHPSTIMAFPEVQLGLLPGGGGTQRLPKLIGVAEALGMMTTGKNIRPAKALKMALVDDVADTKNLRQASIKRLKSLAQSFPLSKEDSEMSFQQLAGSLLTMKGWQDLLLEKNAMGLDFLFQQARKKVLSKTKGHYPAPLKIIDCVEAWTVASGEKGSRDQGFQTEARNFAELIQSPVSKQLINLFFAVTELKKDSFTSDKVTAQPISKLAVLGGGLMGAGIALVSVDKANASVRIRDIDESGINHALKYTYDRINRKVKKRHCTKVKADKMMSNLSGTTSYSGFADVDLVVEAVFESLDLKHQMLKDVEEHCNRETIFASNTSSIPISEIAAKAKRPKNVIGMHYFSPVEKMPLLEIIKTDKTSEQTIATAVAFGKKQGKTVIVVNDGAGFYTSRVLGPYINEAGHLLAEGVAIEDIDKAMTSFGYPVGPITLLDEVGIDVGTKITPILVEAFGERMKPDAALGRLIECGRQGKKNNKGFYDYSIKTKGKRPVDQSVYEDLGVKPNKTMAKETIQERCNLMFINEAVRCLSEGILSSPRDGDIGAIFGLGFPPFLGGPFRYADQLGIIELVTRLQYYENEVGQRFKPCTYLVEMAKKEQSFYN